MSGTAKADAADSSSSSTSTSTSTPTSPPTTSSSTSPHRPTLRKVPLLALNSGALRPRDEVLLAEKARSSSHSYSPRSSQITPRSSRSLSSGLSTKSEMESQNSQAQTQSETRQSSFCSNIVVARTVLLNPKLQLVTQLSKRVEPSNYLLIARTLVKIFEANLRATDLLEWAIRKEVASSGDSNTVLREDSISNQIITNYFGLVGSDYLKIILYNEVQKIARSPSLSEKKIRESASAILNELCNSIPHCPCQISGVCFILQKEMMRQFPNSHNHTSVIASFFMLRFICPALVAPVKMGFLEAQKCGIDTNKNLIAIAKLLQTLANTTQNQQSPRAGKTDKFLKTRISQYNEFISTLTSEQLYVKNNMQPKPYQSKVSPTEEEESIVALQNYVSATVRKTTTPDSPRSPKSIPSCKAISVPEHCALVFSKAEKQVAEYFTNFNCDREVGLVTVGDVKKERCLLLRIDTIFANFFNLFKEMLNLGSTPECLDFTSNLLYSVSRQMGKSHARSYRAIAGLDTHTTLAAGFLFFSYCGWGFIDLAPESKIIDGDAFNIVCNLCFGFESEALNKQGTQFVQQNSSLCVLSGGFLCGWCEESLGMELNVREVFCKSKGDPYCKLVIAPPSKMLGIIEKSGWEVDATASGPWGHSAATQTTTSKAQRMSVPPLELPSLSGSVAPLTAKGQRQSVGEEIIWNPLSDRSHYTSQTEEQSSYPSFLPMSPRLTTPPSPRSMARAWFLKTIRKKPVSSPIQKKKGSKSTKSPVKATKKVSLNVTTTTSQETSSGLTGSSNLIEQDPTCGTLKIASERFILVRSHAFAFDFFEVVKDLFGPQGRHAVHKFASNLLFDFGRTLGAEAQRNSAKPKVDGWKECTTLRSYLSLYGWGKVEINPLSNPTAHRGSKFYALISVTDCFEADSWRLNVGDKDPLLARIEYPTCCMTAGCCSGWFSEAFGTSIAAVEVSCSAKGAKHCQFICAPPDKVESFVRFYLAGQDRASELNHLPTLSFFHSKKDGERKGWFMGEEV